MLQLITAVFRDGGDDTELALLFANQTEDDILVRSDLEEIQKKYPNRFKLWYTVDKPTEGMRRKKFIFIDTALFIIFIGKSSQLLGYQHYLANNLLASCRRNPVQK